MKYPAPLLVLLLGLSPLAPGQAPQSQELKELQFLVGQFACTGESKTNPQGKFQASLECSWDKSGRILICQQQGATPASTSFVWAYAYDAPGKVYTSTDLSSVGFASILVGTVQGGRQELGRDGVWQGKPARYAFHSTFDASSGVLTGAWRRSTGGGPWVQINELRCTKH